MTIVYVDLVAGDDDTGDGSYSNPYLTIAKGDDGLGGGDEVRVAKSVMTTLSGTLAFVEGQTTIATSVDLTGVISADDMISKNYDGSVDGEGWWQVASVTSDTITLKLNYYGATETVTGYHLARPAAAPQVVGRAGASTSSYFKVSGGWDLTTQTRDGLTVIFNSTTTDPLRVSFDFVELCYFVVCGSYDYGGILYFYNVDDCYGHHLYIAGDAETGPLTFYGQRHIIEDCVVAGSGDDAGFYAFLSTQGRISNCYAYSCYYGFSTSSNGYGDVYTDCVAKGCVIGFYPQNGGHYYIDCIAISCTTAFSAYSSDGEMWLINPVVTTATTAFKTVSGGKAWIKDPTLTSVTNEFDVDAYDYYKKNMVFLIDDGVHSVRGQWWTIEEETTEARSGKCIKYSPKTTIEYVMKELKIGVYKIASASGDLSLKAYMKDDASFNGNVYLFAKQDFKRVVEQTEKTMTTSYVEQSITVPEADLVVGENVTLYALILGSAGSVYIDDFSVSQ